MRARGSSFYDGRRRKKAARVRVGLHMHAYIRAFHADACPSGSSFGAARTRTRPSFTGRCGYRRRVNGAELN